MISNQTCSFLVHDPLFFCIGFHVVTNVVFGYVDVFKDRGHLSKLGFQIIRDVKIDFQSPGDVFVTIPHTEMVHGLHVVLLPHVKAELVVFGRDVLILQGAEKGFVGW